MKKFGFLLPAVLILFTAFVFSQPTVKDSTVTIKVRDGNFAVSGFVDSEFTRDHLTGRIGSVLPKDRLTVDIKSDSRVIPFADGWKEGFEKDLQSLKNWKSGLYVFTRDRKKEADEFARFLWETEIQVLGRPGPERFIDPGKKASLIYLFATWCGPCQVQNPELNKLYSSFAAKGFEIIALNTDDEKVSTIETYLRQENIEFKVGFASFEMQTKIIKYTRFPGIPQSILISDGKVVEIYRGASPQVNEALKSAVRRIMDGKE